MGDGDHSTQPGKLYSVRDARYAEAWTEAWWGKKQILSALGQISVFKRAQENVISVVTSRKPKAVWTYEMIIIMKSR